MTVLDFSNPYGCEPAVQVIPSGFRPMLGMMFWAGLRQEDLGPRVPVLGQLQL